MQYVWEFSLGDCQVPVVVGVTTQADGFVPCASVYWHDEPDEPQAIEGTCDFIVSCRPGAGTTPTEGDIARWARWAGCEHPPRDWLIADGPAFRSVRAFAESLDRRMPMPTEQSAPGDWWGEPYDEARRAQVRATWPETKRRAQSRWTS